MEGLEDDYILGVWFAELKERLNFLMMWKRTSQGKWLGEFRIRYYKDSKIFDSEDDKNFTELKEPKDLTEHEMLAKARRAFALSVMGMRGIYEGEIYEDECLVRGDAMKMMECMADREWAHVKVVPKEEIEKYESI